MLMVLVRCLVLLDLSES